MDADALSSSLSTISGPTPFHRLELEIHPNHVTKGHDALREDTLLDAELSGSDKKKIMDLFSINDKIMINLELLHRKSTTSEFTTITASATTTRLQQLQHQQLQPQQH